MENTMTFETYPDMFSNYETFEENEDYDNTIRIFTVSAAWAVDWVFIHYRMSVEDFNNEYTWDDTFDMYSAAKADGVITSESIENR